ncbi:DNA (cytosine-5)-methyltransferase 1 [Paenibacillus tianmuensis]|uniref:DNA (cytosine-5-)-methyltransferase n=1 Tax=Paenibacillus tianmuensis TaxID=624147 RepID=A0A1G4TX90_9BACL|nr:DNA cytosine methyltransferase [Paenibacillus tianmuensis]SCW85938.1 DNA (cytosine-5)-methyltransferase 1 [Paenibacillus tianmuensis]
MTELFIDNFAGGGGASTGIEIAIGRSVDVAINHDPAAIAMHEANHPNTKHYCESVWDVSPREVTGGRPVALCWFSPDCTHHSKARGGKPREKGIRGLAWVAVRWAATVRPRVIMLENVEEFQDWGPLDKEGRPIKEKKGWTFKLFIKTLRKHGYEVEWRILRACDYGAPTIRKRLFMIARCDGKPIVWPEPTHTAERVTIRAGSPLPYRVAADCIDWSIPVPSIFERKKPLAPNTIRRIARGIDKFIIKVAEAGKVPFMAPFITRIGQTGYGGDRLQYELDKPLTTITTKNEHMLVLPHITKFRGGATGHAIDEPLHTITSGAGSVRPAGAAHAMGIVTASMIKHYGGGYNGGGNSVEEPLSTITTTDHNALLCTNLIQYHTETRNSEVRGQTLDQPLMTLDTSNRYGIVSSHLIKFRGDNIGSHMADPVPTITAGGMHIGAVYAFMVAYYGNSVGRAADDPLGTVTTHDRFGLVLVHIQGVPYVIVDIGMRMLTPRELYRAQGFPDSYIIDPIFNGKPFTQAEQVAKCGNSVSPVIPATLVRANLPEHCVPEMTDRYSKADWEAMLA